MGKERITVYNYSHDGKTSEKMEVDAFCVGGNEGVRAYFVHPDNPRWIVFANGDDGNWWYVGITDIQDRYEYVYKIKEAKHFTVVDES